MRIALVDERIDGECAEGLYDLGFIPLRLKAHPHLSSAVRSHTDILISRLGEEYFMTEEYKYSYPRLIKEIEQALFGAVLSFTSDLLRDSYPKDCSLNFFTLDGTIVANSKTLSPAVLKRAKEMGLRLINVKQGYPACTALRLNGKAVITADKGIAKALVSEGFRAYLIEGGGVALPPYEYGFIGGCAGVFQNTVYFLGDVSRHASFEKIKQAIEQEGMNYISLSGGELRDLGGILFAESNI